VCFPLLVSFGKVFVIIPSQGGIRLVDILFYRMTEVVNEREINVGDIFERCRRMEGGEVEFDLRFFAKKHGKYVTRRATIDHKCKQFTSKQNVPCFTYLQLNEGQHEGYRTATGTWVISNPTWGQKNDEMV